jgi:hypothetical protein
VADWDWLLTPLLSLAIVLKLHFKALATILKRDFGYPILIRFIPNATMIDYKHCYVVGKALGREL